MSHLNGSSSHKYQVRSNYNRVTQKGQLTLIFLFSPPCCIPQRPRSRNRALVLRYFYLVFSCGALLFLIAIVLADSGESGHESVSKSDADRCSRGLILTRVVNAVYAPLLLRPLEFRLSSFQPLALTTKQLHASLYTTAKSSDFGRILRYLNRQRAKRSTCIHALETIVRAAAAHEAQLRKGNDYTA